MLISRIFSQSGYNSALVNLTGPWGSAGPQKVCSIATTNKGKKDWNVKMLRH